MNKIQKTRIDKITELHNEIGGYLKITLDKAIEIGGLLSGQKAELNHGEWLPWVNDNLPFSERLARDYMRFHERRDEFKSANLADLTAARKALTDAGTSETTETNSLASTLWEFFYRDLLDISETIESMMDSYLKADIIEAVKMEIPSIPGEIWQAVDAYIKVATDISRLSKAVDLFRKLGTAYVELSFSAEQKMGAVVKEVNTFFPTLSCEQIWGNLDGIIEAMKQKLEEMETNSLQQ